MKIEPVDNITPLEAFALIKHLPRPFIFSGGEGRPYSYAGADPFIEVKTDGSGTTLTALKETRLRLAGKATDPFEAVSMVFNEIGQRSAGPFPFNGGAAGYFSYDLKDIISSRGTSQKPAMKNKKDLPLCIIGFYAAVFIYDHLRGKGFLVTEDVPGAEEGRLSLRKALEGARPSLESAEKIPPAQSRFASNTSKQEYMEAIRKAKAYIASGDIYQINLSQRLNIPWKGDPFALYSHLTGNRPAPFSSYMDFGGFKIISNSPERFLMITDAVAETSPIKGTRPRGLTPEEDLLLIQELRCSQKERAEHVMIVDMERNDLGMVAVPGTVEVTEFETIETYPKLHHMVSTVRGRLKPGVDSLACLRAAFPGGSVTGAPKIRAMEIIDELEKDRRGIYTGCIGWVDFSGNLDMAMTIRTAVYKDETIYLSVGGGIVADSEPEAEYEESILKAKDFLDVLKADDLI